MAKATIYQCIPGKYPVQTANLIKLLLEKVDVEILLDLEDSIQSLENPEENEKLKDNARRDVVEILSFLPYNTKYHIRINATNSNEFSKDIEVIKQLEGRLKSVILSKVEQVKDIDNFQEFINPYVNRLSLILESEKGFQNLKKILDRSEGLLVDYIIFGNYDYQLDKNIFPIKDQDSPEYWDIVIPLIKNIEKQGYKFANSPYAGIRDVKTLINSVKKLEAICENDFALISLHKSQTFSYSSYLQSHQEEYTCNKRLEGRHIKNHKLKDSIFSYTDYGKLITPQEAMLAKKYNGI